MDDRARLQVGWPPRIETGSTSRQSRATKRTATTESGNKIGWERGHCRRSAFDHELLWCSLTSGQRSVLPAAVSGSAEERAFYHQGTESPDAPSVLHGTATCPHGPRLRRRSSPERKRDIAIPADGRVVQDSP